MSYPNLKQKKLSFWFSPSSPSKGFPRVIYIHFPCTQTSAPATLPNLLSNVTSDLSVLLNVVFTCPDLGLLDHSAPCHLTPSFWLFWFFSCPFDCSFCFSFWAPLLLPVPYMLVFPNGVWSSLGLSLLKDFIHSHGFNYAVYFDNVIT